MFFPAPTAAAPRRRRVVAPVVLAAASVATIAAAPAVRADVKQVNKVTMTGGPGGQAAPRTSTTTVYYKGNKVRTEGGGPAGGVTIVDGDAGKVYNLDPGRKTYFVQPLALPAGAMEQAAKMLDMKTTVDMKPLTKARTIAGKPAKGYAYTATIAMSLKPGAMGGGPGGPGGPGGAGAPKAAPPQTLGTLKIVGEQWVTQAVKLPAGASAMRAYARISRGVGAGMPGLKPLFTKFEQIKGLPLASTQSITATGMIGMGMGGGQPGAGGKPGGGMRMTTEAVSLAETTLPATLFAIPAGYKQVEPPMRGMGGPGGGPGGPGGGPGAPGRMRM